MRRDFDKIIFDDLEEIGCLLDVIAEYVKQNPKEKDNETLKHFYYLLEEIEFTW